MRPFLFVVAVVSTVVGLLPAVVAAHRPAAAASLTPPPPTMPSSTVADGYANAPGERGAVSAATATPAPPPPAPRPIPEIIASAFAPLGPGAVAWGQRIALCESSYNPNAVNPASAASGLFQFLPSTWAGTPYAAYSPFDPVANAQAAAWLLKAYGPAQWECRA